MGTIEEVNKGNEERIYVSVRVRPLNGKEILRNDVSDWECINDNTIIYKNATLHPSDRSMYPTAYTFDRVFRPNCSTREVYEQGAKDVAISVVGGMNSSVFAYGQTSSGKTYTMFGITEYAIADIYEYIDKHPERDFILKFSAMEIYNESVRDLLSLDSTPLRLLDDPERGTIVEKLTEEVLRDWDHVLELLSICEAQRQIGETSLNEMSSRSHQIIRLTIESSSREYLGRDSTNVLASAVNFVDLAGSERASQTLSAGARLKEGCHINRSLLTLGTIIRKLSKGRNGHIPYRDSKLTRILQTSLGGNARTAIICTMSPARSHVEQSRNTLLFASCAKEVSTNAQVNIVMSDKALVKHLQREVARLESELRTPQSAFVSSNISAALRDKDLQIEKLEKDIKDLILQRDIAQSQVKDMLQMVRDDRRSDERVEMVRYPHSRMQDSQDARIPEQETSILADPLSLDSDNRTFSDVNSRTSSEDHHFSRVPYIDKNFVHNNAASPAQRILIDSSNFSDSDSCHSWEEIEKQSNVASDDLCREVCCVETQESSNRGAKLSFKDNDKAIIFPHLSETAVSMESESFPLGNDQRCVSPSSKDNSEMNGDMVPVRVKVEIQEVISKEEEEKVTPVCDREEEYRSIDFLDMPSIDRLSMTPHVDKDSSVRRSLKFAKSRSCNASIYADSASPWFRMTDYSENVSDCGSERESVGFDRTLSLTNFYPNEQSSSVKDSQCSPVNAFDIEVDNPVEKFPTTKDVISSNDVVKEKPEPPIEKEIITNFEKEIKPKANESPKKNVKDVGLDPIEDDCPILPSWPVEFKRIQREIIELWHACNVSLVHRTYFFLLFQGDPLDAIYLEVELRRLKFLKQKFNRGEKIVVNGRHVTLSSSEKDLRQERRMLSKLMSKKLSEDERGTLFLKWGIPLKTKMRRLQLAYTVWAHIEDVNHISDSAFLVAKLVGLIEPGEAPDKEMFGLNFAPRCSTNNYGFKRSLVSLL